MARVLLLLVGSCLLFAPFSERIRACAQSQKEPGVVLAVSFHRWRPCGGVALDSSNPEVSCCGLEQVFHRPTQRCCSVKRGFFVIHKDPEKTEAEDCQSYYTA
ncbi:hypothetical protein HJG60_009034 [Phyllostomus discolor]|uniref:Uncharacterized protein n=1 Tax=Phyllostomus discolor TaxID=89673 RepID=A0A833YPP3_9CHIR|nr:hypothetical protein HJG60_009034 [Phyllostomus discolor]